jgi:hypothetical protein
MKVWSKSFLLVAMVAIGTVAWLSYDPSRPPSSMPRETHSGKRPVAVSSEKSHHLSKPAAVAQGRAAAEAAFAIESPALREESLRTAMQAWATTDPAAALAWCAKLSDPRDAEQSLLHVCLQISETDPAAAIRWASQYHLDESPGDLIGNLAVGWASRDLSAAQNWVSEQSPGELRDGLMARIVYVRAQSDPAAAARLVVDAMGDGEHQIEAAICVLHQWISQDLEAAKAWVALFPAGALKDRANGELAGMQAYLPQ